MKVLKYIVLGLLALIIIWLVLCIMGPTSLQLERSTTVKAPVSEVYQKVSCLDEWPNWSPWAEMDPGMINTYSENACGQDAWVSWIGEKSGEGKQTIVEAKKDLYIKTLLAFAPNFEENYSEWNFREENGITTVSWNFIGADTPFYMRGMNVVMKGMLGSSYETGLLNLKEVTEEALTKEQLAYEISEIESEDSKYLLISGELNPAEIKEFYTQNFGKIMSYMEESGIEMTGHPTGLFYSWTDTLTSMSAAIPVNKDTEGTDEIEFRAIEGGRTLQIDYYGAYAGSGAAHYAMDDYMEANGLEVNGAVMEIYITDPTSEPDTTKWQTKIIYPVSVK